MLNWVQDVNGEYINLNKFDALEIKYSYGHKDYSVIAINKENINKFNIRILRDGFATSKAAQRWLDELMGAY